MNRNNDEIVRGGQGKSGQQIQNDTFWFAAFMVLALATLVLALVSFGGSVTQ